MLTDLPPVSFLQLIGLTGAALYMMNYALLTLRMTTSDSASYFLMNLAASTLVLVSLYEVFSAASFAIQVFWIAVSLMGIFRTLPRTPAPRRVRSDRLRPLV